MHSIHQTSTEYVPGIILGSWIRAHIFPPLTQLTSSGEKKILRITKLNYSEYIKKNLKSVTKTHLNCQSVLEPESLKSQ